MDEDPLSSRLRKAGLRVTPQRLAVLKALEEKNHPTADIVIEYVQRSHPTISTGTIYHILDTLVEKKVINKVYTHGGVMRYDPVLEKHHHLHDTSTNTIVDYFDDDLFELIRDYLKVKQIDDFTLEEIKIKLIGKFNK
jgi:Fur family peroxide stress response transcriptional regulator